MSGYVQRYPFAPKAVWWKRYTDTIAMGERVIYRATDKTGFELDGIPQRLCRRTLARGILTATENVRYIDIEGKALLLLGKVYQYNADTDSLDEHDLADEELELIGVESSKVIHFEDNSYIRQFKFDCIKDGNIQSSIEQPINGLLINSDYLTLKTHNFSLNMDKPKNGDILQYQGSFWRVEEVQVSEWYSPRVRYIHYLTISKIKDRDNGERNYFN